MFIIRLEDRSLRGQMRFANCDGGSLAALYLLDVATAARRTRRDENQPACSPSAEAHNVCSYMGRGCGAGAGAGSRKREGALSADVARGGGKRFGRAVQGSDDGWEDRAGIIPAEIHGRFNRAGA